MKSVLVILGIVTIAIIFGLGYGLSYYKQKSDRWESNYMAGQGNNVNVVNFTTDELKKLLKANNDSLLQRVSDSLKMKVRPKNITQINNYKYFYNDTIITTIPLIKVNNTYPFKLDSGCFKMEGYFDIDKSKMLITNKQFSDSITDVSGQKRAKIFKWLFGGIRLGKFEQFNITFSNCGGIITKKQINVIKN